MFSFYGLYIIHQILDANLHLNKYIKWKRLQLQFIIGIWNANLPLSPLAALYNI